MKTKESAPITKFEAKQVEQANAAEGVPVVFVTDFVRARTRRRASHLTCPRRPRDKCGTNGAVDSPVNPNVASDLGVYS